MKAQVLPSNLKKALKIVKPAMAKGSFLPVLENVLVKVAKGNMEITATDLAFTICASIGAKIQKEGATTVSFKALDTLAKNLPEEPLGLHLKKDGKLSLVQASKTISLETIEPQEFPLVRTAKGRTYKALDDLVDGCGFVQHALGDESRLVLSYAEAKQGKLYAADGFRLAIAPGFGGQASLCRSLVNFLARQKQVPRTSWGRDKNLLKLTTDDNLITAWYEDYHVTGQQFEGRFPDWEQVIPEPTWTITVDFKEFLEKVSTAFSLKPLIIIFKPKKGRLYFEASLEIGRYEDWITASCNGKRDILALNPKYLLDALKAREPFLKEGWLKLKGHAGESAIMLVDQHTKLIEVVMPMHLSR